MLIGEPQPESLVVEIHSVSECCGRAIVEVGCAAGEPTQDRPLEAPDVLPLAGDQCPPGIGHDLNLAGRLVAKGVNRHVSHGKRGSVVHAVAPVGNGEGRVGGTYIKRRRD